MKKLMTLVTSLLLLTTILFVGCGKKPEDENNPPVAEKPVITLSVDQKEFAIDYTQNYTLPTAECLSKVDGSKLVITVTATNPAEEEATIKDGVLSITTAGLYTVKYNANDKDEDRTKADEVVLKITVNPMAKPVITVDGEKVISLPFALSYTLPTATATSNYDSSKLAVAVKVTDPDGSEVEIVDGKIAPAKVGEFTITYSATDVNPEATKADDVVVKVTFTALEKPVIVVAKDDITTDIVKEYTLPTATAESKLDGSALTVSVSATNPNGEAAVIENGVLKPTMAGKYVVTYKVNEKAPLNTAADDVVINVTFNDTDPVFTEKEGLVKTIDDLTMYAAPAFEDAYTISHNFYNYVPEDFDIVLDVTHANGLMAKRVNNPETARTYPSGKLYITYRLTLKGTEKTFELEYQVQVSNSIKDLLLVPEGKDVKAEIYVDDKISDDEIVRVVSPTVDWSGMMIYGHGNAILSRLNASQNTALVFHMFNSSKDKLKLNVSISEFVSEDKVNLVTTQNYVVNADTFFDIVIMKDLCENAIESLEFSRLGSGFAVGDEFSFLGLEYVDSTTYKTQVWDDGAVPTDLTVRTDLQNDVINVPLAQYDANGLKGLRIANTAEGAGYADLDFMTNATIANDFAKITDQAKHNIFLRYTVTNVGAAETTFWAYSGHDTHNMPSGNMYMRTIQPNESMVMYVAPAFMGDNYVVGTEINYIRLALSAMGDLVVSDVNIFNFPQNADTKVFFTSSSFEGKGEYDLPTMSDSYENGKFSVTLSDFDFATGENPGARLPLDSPVMQKFLSLNSDEGMKITLENVDEATDFWGVFYMGDDQNTYTQKPWIKKGDKTVLYFKNDNSYKNAVTGLEFWVYKNYGASIKMTIEFVNDKDGAEVVKLFDYTDGNDFANKLQTSHSGGGTMTVTYSAEDDSFIVKAEGGDEWLNFQYVESIKAKLPTYYETASVRRMQVLAFDVEEVGASDTLWIAFGKDENLLRDNYSTYAQEIGSQKRTIYVTTSMMVNNATAAQYEDGVFNYFGLNLANCEFKLSNFRILNFAGAVE